MKYLSIILLLFLAACNKPQEANPEVRTATEQVQPASNQGASGGISVDSTQHRDQEVDL